MEKIDFKDCTAIIPFSCDSQDRLENLELVVEYLTHHFDMTIIVKEVSQTSILMNHPIIKKVKYVWEFSDEDIFHRTKVLNDMLEDVNTKFVWNYDTDVLFPVQSYVDAVNALRAGEVFVFPYLGKFYEINRRFMVGIKEKMEVDWIDLNVCSINHPQSVGGSIFLNTEVYKKLGGECTVFKSWGWEDVFRINTFKKFGYNICRVGTVLYHMEHWRGKNSTPNHEHYRQNEKLFFDTQNLSREELAIFIYSYSRFKEI